MIVPVFHISKGIVSIALDDITGRITSRTVTSPTSGTPTQHHNLIMTMDEAVDLYGFLRDNLVKALSMYRERRIAEIEAELSRLKKEKADDERRSQEAAAVEAEEGKTS